MPQIISFYEKSKRVKQDGKLRTGYLISLDQKHQTALVRMAGGVQVTVHKEQIKEIREK